MTEEAVVIQLEDYTDIASDFSGSARKFAVLFRGERYMVKCSGRMRGRGGFLRSEDPLSEHIGCRIFEAAGLPVQETVPARRTDEEGREEIVVLCKDFRQDGEQLFEAEKCAKTFALPAEIAGADRAVIEKVFAKIEPFLSEGHIRERFWDMFVIDALIGNEARGMADWGFLSRDRIRLRVAPVYDCGAALAAGLSEEEMEEILSDEEAFCAREWNISCNFSMNGKRPFCRELFAAPPPELEGAMRRILPRIDMEKVRQLICGAEGMSAVRKAYLCKAVSLRYDRMLRRKI